MRASPRALVAAALGAAALVALLLRPSKTQWDLKVYMACARVQAAGGDPYATQPVVDGSRFQCLYPPLAMDLYRPFDAASDALGRDAGERAWAGLKVLSLFAMLWLWRAFILKPGADLPRLLFAAIAFGSPFWSDFRAGNAGSFEHLVLWAGLAAFVAGRDFLFAALVAASAQPKLLPLAFLPLVVAKPRPNARALVAGGALAVAVFALNEAFHPGLLRGFFRQLADPTQPWRYERGPNNCSFVGLVQHGFETLTGNRPDSVAGAARVNAVWALAVVAATGRSLWRIWGDDADETDKRRRAVLLYAAAYALIAPRLKDYSFLLLIPPALAALESDAPLAARAGILLFAVLNSAKGLAEKAGLGGWSLLAGYFKLYAVMLTWYALARRSAPARSCPSPSPAPSPAS